MRRNSAHHRATRRLYARVDEAWHAYMMELSAPDLEAQRLCSVINFKIIDRMPKRAVELMNELGPHAPYWVNVWFENGKDPGHRRVTEPPVRTFSYEASR